MSGQLLSERTLSGTYYALFDALGSTIGLTDGSGNLVSTWTYDPWGNVLSRTGTVRTPFLFDGTYFDDATGLYKMGARYYDPTLGRWTQPDPVRGELTNPQALNLYAFVGNNPVNLTDRSGYFWILVLAIVWIVIRVLSFVCVAYGFARYFGWINGRWTTWTDFVCLVVAAVTVTRWVAVWQRVWRWIW
jgi:RHS repeat-associated protein